MAAFTLNESRADLLRAIDAGRVTEDWYNGEPGQIRQDAQSGKVGTVVTGKVRVMKAAGLCETNPADAGLHVRGIRITDAGRQALADYDAKNDALDALAAHHAYSLKTRADLDAREVELVAAARQFDASWQAIGDALGGMLRNNASRKFEPLLDTTVTRQVTVKPTDSSSEETP
ncbi:hypothetical protein [Micromonospora profundi]|uniref:hypothetical protein n=1 Tax=Micromonospora profundi TaxID=1420889 RepID=UPI003669128E